MDGTFASLTEGKRSSIARIHAMLSGEMGPTTSKVQLHYAPGQQWAAWQTLPQLISGLTLDHNIQAAYAWLAQHWQPGNPLYFFGYSRGGIGVCALAEMVDRVGLLRPEAASPENIQRAWLAYRHQSGEELPLRLRHAHVPIRMVGILDTVMSLGIRLPFLWAMSEPGFDYSKGRLARNVYQGVHALALDETRTAFEPILWESHHSHQRVEQIWFRGCHADIGGQLGGHEFARPLANLPLVWLMTQAAEAGLPLPHGWHRHHPCDQDAPRLGSWHSWGKAFLMRGPRQAGALPSEALHPSVACPYEGPALLSGHLAPAAKARRPRLIKIRLPKGDGADPTAA
ncbi:DUF2235 domain-containing protein [Paracoccus sp. MBLB3053]|uniref:DUF2235 domain-containing protein n=1 Tax=Paracoccus aurantius TaxID=3073814 RepID=A0ABU2HPN2_9RHOB|nr:DUF2235 domain-containing protein [Paracoccus sp. MBLB3053]MDS9467006.1 DUF2235 domain-containing protein [Paracoccus sp. MBLB3053]